MINRYEYELLTKTWQGPYGAAYNACWDFCKENGLLVEKMSGWHISDKGKEAVKSFKNSS